MSRKRDIVPPDRRARTDGVATGVLGADERREEQRARRHQVGEEAERVADRVVQRDARGRAPPQVEQRLRVEGEGPAEGAARREGGSVGGDGVAGAGEGKPGGGGY